MREPLKAVDKLDEKKSSSTRTKRSNHCYPRSQKKATQKSKKRETDTFNYAPSQSFLLVYPPASPYFPFPCTILSDDLIDEPFTSMHNRY